MVPLSQETEYCFPATVIVHSVGCCRAKMASGSWCWQIFHGLDCQSGSCDDVVQWDGEWGGINWTPEKIRWFLGTCG